MARGHQRPNPDDPLARVLALDAQRGHFGKWVGPAAALLLHVGGLMEARNASFALANFSKAVLTHFQEMLSQEIEVGHAPIKPPEPEPPKSDPEAARAPPDRQLHPSAATPVAQLPPVLAQAPDPNAPIDLTGDGFVMGSAQTPTSGIVSGVGAPRGSGAGPASGSGKKPGAVAVEPSVDLSRAAMPVSLELLRNLGRTCGFPPEATTAQVEAASVLLTVRVAADGKIVSVSVISERPAGYGFGARAKRCIQRAQFQAALDVAGHPVVSNTPPITFNFELQ